MPVTNKQFESYLGNDLPDDKFESYLRVAEDETIRAKIKAPPAKLPDLPKPRIPGLTEEEHIGPVEKSWEEIGGGPFSPVATVTRPLSRAADWIMEGMEQGPPRVIKGAKQVFAPEASLDTRAQGAADVIGGAMETTRPLMAALPGAIARAPIRTGLELAASAALPPVVHKAGEALGAPPGATNLASELTAAAPMAVAMGRGVKKSLTSPEPSATLEPSTSNIDPPVAPDFGATSVNKAPEAKLPASPQGKLQPQQRKSVPKSTLSPEELLPLVRDAKVRSRTGIQRKYNVSYKTAKAVADQLKAEGTKEVGKQAIQQPQGQTPALAAPPETRPVTDILKDESGSLDVSRIFDLLGRAKRAVGEKDPYEERLKFLDSLGRATTGSHRAYTDLMRETHPLWVLQELVKETGKDLGYSAKLGEGLEKHGIELKNQPAALAESMSGTMGLIERDLERTSELLMPFKQILPEAKEYGIRERHMERGLSPFVHPKTGEVVPYRLPGGETLESNLKAMQAYELAKGPQGMQEVHAALSMYRRINDDLFTRLKNEGIIPESFYKESQKFNQKYIPFQRLDFVLREINNDKIIPLGGKAFHVGEKEFRQHLVGSEKEILDPMMGLVRNIYRTNYAVAKNNAKKALAGLADLPGGPEFVIRVNPKTGKPYSFRDSTGVVRKPGVPLGYEKVDYLIDGVKKRVMVPKDVAAYYEESDRETANMITRMMGHWAGALRFGVVSNPRFWVGNMARDYQTALLTTGLDPVAWAKGFVQALVRDVPQNYLDKIGLDKKLYDMYRDAGASYSGAFQYAGVQKTAKNLLDSMPTRMAKMLWDPTASGYIGKLPGINLLEWAGQTAELTPRLGVFGKQLESGTEPFAAGFASRNATINFAIGGAKLKSLYQIVPFLKGRTGATRTGAEYTAKQPALSAMRLAYGIGIPAVTIYYANILQHPQVWDSLDDDIKRNNFIWINDDKKDSKGRYTGIISVPVDGVPQAFLSAVVGSMEVVRGADPGGWLRNAIQFFSDTSPVGFTRKGKFSPNELGSAVLPPPAAALYTLGTGEDLYTGRNLERKPNIRRDAPPHERYNLDAKTPIVWTAKQLDKVGVMDKSPHVLENLPGQIFGHWGKWAAESMPTEGGDEKGVAKRMWDALKLQPFTKPLFPRPEVELQGEAADQSRGTRMQDMTREADRIMRAAKNQQDIATGAQIALPDLVKRFPSRPPELIREEFRGVLTRMKIAKDKNFSSQERMIYARPSESRAELIWQTMEQLPAAKRPPTWDRWRKIGIITPRVSQEYRLLLDQKKRMESAPVTP